MSANSAPQSVIHNLKAEIATKRAREHIHHLAQTIGARASTGVGEWRAAQYALDVLRQAKLDTRLEPFSSGRSTYRPYALAFGAGLFGTVLHRLLPSRSTAGLSAVLNAAGAWAFFRETELTQHWARRLLPKGTSQNVVAVVPPRGNVQRRVVVYGHLDTHRTPIFYSTPVWLQAFGSLVGACWAGLLADAFNHGLAALRDRKPWVPLTRAANALQLFGLAMTLHADRTPYAPGANDNASGAGSVLALGERLAQEPLEHTEVWIVLNGCEELGAYGIAALLERHGAQLRNAFFLSLDMVGIGAPTLLTREGLLLPSRPDQQLLDLAREAAAANPGLLAGEHAGGAYTDTGMVVRRGFRGLTIDSQLPDDHPGKAHMGYWHQLSDTVDKIEPACLERTHAFVWALLQEIDKMHKQNKKEMYAQSRPIR